MTRYEDLALKARAATAFGCSLGTSVLLLPLMAPVGIPVVVGLGAVAGLAIAAGNAYDERATAEVVRATEEKASAPPPYKE